MEGSLGFLFAALLVTWVAIGLYLFFLSGRLATLRRELESLKRDSDDSAKDDEEADRR